MSRFPPRMELAMSLALLTGEQKGVRQSIAA